MYFIAFRERGRERETHRCEREKLIGCLSYMPRLRVMGAWTGMEPATQACALTRNRTCDLSVTGQHSNQWNHTSQGSTPYFLKMESR